MVPDSPASRAGLVAGDLLVKAEGQRILTYADFTRVLELAPDVGTLQVVATRKGRETRRTIQLPKGWRVSDDPSWRASLHTVGPGAGFWGRPANAKERTQHGLTAQDLALKVTFVWAPYAKRIMRVGDVVVELDGNRSNMNMRQCHAHLHLNRDWGDKIKLIAVRDRKQVELEMNLPAKPPFE